MKDVHRDPGSEVWPDPPLPAAPGAGSVPPTPAERERMLEAADRDRFGDLAEGAAASRCYRTLCAPLDPDDPLDASRLLWTVETIEPVGSAGPSVVAGVVGFDELAARAACRGLAWFYASQRREFEALVMARRALALSEASGGATAWERCEALLRVCDAHQALEDEPNVAASIAALEDALPRCDDPRTWRPGYFVHATRFEGRVAAKDVASAEAESTRMEAAVPAGVSPPGDPRWFAYCDASLALAADDPAEALRAIDAVRDVPVVRRGAVLTMDLLEVRCLLETGARAAACEKARQVLTHLEPDSSRDVLSTGRRIRDAARLGDLISPVDPTTAHRAYETAAGAVLERILELDRCAREMPELTDLGSEELHLLAEFRARFAAEHAGLLRRVAAHLAARVRAADGTWIPVGQYLLTDGGVRVTHGICAPCRTELLSIPA